MMALITNYFIKNNVLIFVTKFCLLLSCLSFISSPAFAGDDLGPTITISKAQGDKCVLPVDEIRRVHPNLLKHDRILTVREGIRSELDGKKLHGSLKACINCHAIKESGQYVRVDNPKHFCKSCHVYAGVSLDCFQCHRDIPE